VTLVVHAGKRYTNLKSAELAAYVGKRAQRGLKLPRGFQNVSTIRNWADRNERDGDLVM
jgi:topoisomerase-4 subunit A